MKSLNQNVNSSRWEPINKPNGTNNNLQHHSDKKKTKCGKGLKNHHEPSIDNLILDHR